MLRQIRGSAGATRSGHVGAQAPRGRLPVRVCATSQQSTSVSAAYSNKKIKRVRLKTNSDCELAISRYPIFLYNAVGGGGYADVEDLGNGILKLKFDTEGLVIPALSWRTASIFFLPIPPPLNIEIETQRLEGSIDLALGVVELNFTALFRFTAGPFYTAPPLTVNTLLTTETTRGSFQVATGKRLTDAGSARLVGAATVPKVDDVFMDTFLMLPTDALAVMSAELEFEYEQ